MQIVARRYDTGQVVRCTISAGVVREVRAEEAGAEAPWIAPGLIDVQVNGYGGREFSSADLCVEDVDRIVRRQFDFGVTGLCPTVTTNRADVIEHAMRTIAAACERSPDVAQEVVGIHLEGPYLSSEDGPRGAHPAEHCRRPDYEEFRRFQEAAGGRIKIVTLSPEYDGAPRFIEQVTATGVVAAIGHTSADSAQIHAAVKAGARLSTHLGNGAHRQLRRHPNYLWDQLAEDRLMASLIVDGHHLPAEVVKTFVRAKTPERVLLVSDLSGMAGLPAGRYASQLCDLEILPDGRLVIAGQDQLLAGASLPIGAGVVNLMQFAGLDLRTAIDCATLRPAQLLGIPRGGLESGDRADLVVFDFDAEDGDHASRFKVQTTIASGEIRFNSS